jgi:electron transfer flavoprotein alpha subunit
MHQNPLVSPFKKGERERKVKQSKGIWVLLEITAGEEIDKLSPGLLTEARGIAEKAGGRTTALVFGEAPGGHSELLAQYGIGRALAFKDPLLANPSAEAYAATLLPRLQMEGPWLVLLGDTPLGRGLAPRLAAALGTGLVSGCVRIDILTNGNPLFYRPVYGGQLYQEVVFTTDKTMVVTMDPSVLDDIPAAKLSQVEIEIIEPGISPDIIKIGHLAYLPADFRTVDVTEADTVVAAGMGAATEELLPLVNELAALLEGAVGTTRPVVDTGRIPRERMIGQTGKVVSPSVYLALGVSGATHHVGGIQGSGTIVSINRDPQAPIFRSSDVGLAADLRQVLPKLIEKIKRARENGEII